jgi:peptidoglycan pentaglycine glycine transferase (the first glycine)
MGLTTHVAEALDEAQVARWRSFLSALPGGHYSHDPDWAIVEAALEAKRPHRAVFSWTEQDGELRACAAGVRRDSPIPGLAYYDFFRGPVFDRIETLELWADQVVPLLNADALLIRAAPYLQLSEGGSEAESTLVACGYKRDDDAGAWGTLRTDIARSGDELWSTFPQRTRQGIRKGERAGMDVRAEDDPSGWEAFVEMHRSMGERSGMTPFTFQDVEAMSRYWFDGGRRGTLLVARIDGRPVAASILLTYKDVGYYLAAGSTRSEKGLTTSYLLAWEALRWAQENGCSVLDWCGYNLTARQGDPHWGTNLFKAAFAAGAEPTTYCAPHQRDVATARYSMLKLAKKVNALMRRVKS